MKKKVVVGDVHKVMATFYSDLAKSSATEESRNFYKELAEYFCKKAKETKTKNLVKGTIEKVN